MFPCTKCGLCCKNLENSEIYASLNRGDGICINFNLATSLCEIYENRPLACRIEASRNIYFPEMEVLQYLEMNINICHQMQKSSGISSNKSINKFKEK